MTQTFSPTVLLFDDDPAVLQFARRRFLDQTSLGVIVVETLSEAKKLIDNNSLRFDAIISDLFVEAGKDDPINNLNDGIDLLAYAKQARPDVARFVLSVFSERKAFVERATENNLGVIKWFHKLDAGAQPEERTTAPWHTVERYLVKSLLNSGDISSVIGSNIIDVDALSDVVREKIVPTVRTYIQELESPYRVDVPIEALCRKEDNYWIADAIHLGLIQSGVGDTKREALEYLAEAIQEQYSTLREAEESNLDDLTTKLLSEYRKHISIITN